MRRFVCITFNVLTAISLVLAMLIAGLWVRSHFASDLLLIHWSYVVNDDDSGWSDTTSWETGRGGVMHQAIHDTWPAGTSDVRLGLSSPMLEHESGPPLAWTELPMGFVVRYDVDAGDGRPSEVFTVPFWLPLLLFAALPITLGIRYARRRRAPGHCHTCGYDLRATPDRCPECGTAKT